MVGFGAGFVDAIAGGGGLLTLPSLALAGLDPVASVATNKLASTFGSGSTTLAFWRAGKVETAMAPSAVAAGIGALGALALPWAPRALLVQALPVVLLAVALTGSFYMIGFVVLGGFGLTRAMAGARFANFGSNFGALLIYAMSGHILVPAGLALGAGAFLGARLGAHSALREGARLVRPLIVVVCCAMALKLMAAPGGLLSSEWKFFTGG